LDINGFWAIFLQTHRVTLQARVVRGLWQYSTFNCDALRRFLQVPVLDFPIIFDNSNSLPLHNCMFKVGLLFKITFVYFKATHKPWSNPPKVAVWPYCFIITSSCNLEWPPAFSWRGGVARYKMPSIIKNCLSFGQEPISRKHQVNFLFIPWFLYEKLLF
jgi:hypothetical protein